MQTENIDKNLFLDLKKGSVCAFKQIYKLYWSDLYRYAYNIIRKKEVCEEIVQEIFFSLWNKRQALQLTHSLQAYLFTAVKFQTLNYIRSEKVRKNYADSYAAFENNLVDNSNEENIYISDLKKRIEVEVSKLPDRCQQIFRMSRNEYQSIKNISDVLNLSHKTVENQLTKALKHLRSSLSGFLFLFIASVLSL